MRPLKMKTDATPVFSDFTPPNYPHPVRLRRDMRPSEGIWYWGWFAPASALELLEIKQTEFGDLTHEQAWRFLIVPELVRHYRLGKRDVAKLLPLYRSLPRGSVQFGPNSKLWRIHHAGDSPRGEQNFMMLTPARFSLSSALLKGNVAFVTDLKLAMCSADQLALQAVIGTVPYITRKA
jgi:hypothetical protein